jgi:hypothetical protein
MSLTSVQGRDRMMHTTRTSTTKYLKIKFKHVGGAGSSTTDVLAIFILAGVVSPFFLLATGPAGGPGLTLLVLIILLFLSQNQNHTTSEAPTRTVKPTKVKIQFKSKMLAPAPNSPFYTTQNTPVYRTPVTSPVRRRGIDSSISAISEEVDENNCYVTTNNSSANPPAITTTSSRARYMISPTGAQALSAPFLPELDELRRHHSPSPIRRTRLPLKARNQGLFHVGDHGENLFEDFY